MADLASAFDERVMADAAVRDALDLRLFPLAAPQGTPRPYARYQIFRGPQAHHMKGPVGFDRARIRVGVFDDDYVRGRAIAQAFVDAMTGGATVGGVTFGQTFAEGPDDVGGEDTQDGFINHTSVDLLVWHKLA